MSRTASALVLKDNDRMLLEDIASGRTVAGEDITIRARAILKMSEGQQLKDIAKELNVRPNTITDIRKRYLRKGIISIGDSSRSGRPVEVGTEAIAQALNPIIDNAQKTNSAVPTVRELSKTLHAPEAKIRSFLKEKGIIQGRKSIWDFHTSNGFIAHWIDVVGLYIAPDQQLIIVQTGSDDNRPTYTQNGKLVVHNRELASEVQNIASDGEIELSKALEVFCNYANKPNPTRAGNALQYVHSVISGFPAASSNIEYHLISCGKPVIETGRVLIPNTYLHSTDSLEKWLAQIEGVINVLYQNGDSAETILGICKGIENCLRLDGCMPDIFEWKKAAVTAEEDMNTGNGHQPEEKKQSQIAPGTMISTCQIMGNDGKWIQSSVTSYCALTQDKFDTSSTEAYMYSFNEIEQAAISITHEAARSFCEIYLNEIGKKKNEVKANDVS